MQIFYPTRILSSASAGDLMTWIHDNLEQGHNRLLINLQNVLFMDSTGLATLVAALKTVRQTGGNLALCSLNGQARMLFEMAGMEEMFEVYNTATEFEKGIVCTTL